MKGNMTQVDKEGPASASDGGVPVGYGPLGEATQLDRCETLDPLGTQVLVTFVGF